MSIRILCGNSICKIFSIIFYFSIATFKCFSQSNESFPFAEDMIKIDPLTRKPDKPIPFDKPFSLIVSLKNTDDISSLFAYVIQIKTSKKACEKYYAEIYDSLIKASNDPSKIDILKKEKSDAIDNCIKQLGKRKGRFLANDTMSLGKIPYRIVDKNLIVDFPALPPNTEFDFCIVRKFAGERLNDLRIFIDALYKNQTQQLNDTLRKEFEGGYGELKKAIEKQPYALTRTFFIKDYLFISKPADSSNDRVLENWFINNRIDTFYSKILVDTFKLSLDSTLLPSLYRTSQKADSAELDISSFRYVFRIIGNKLIGNVANGKISLKYDLTSKVFDNYAFGERIANLDTSLNYVLDVINKAEKVYLSTNQTDTLLRGFIRKMTLVLNQLNANKKIIATNYKEIINSIQGEDSLRYSEWYINTSESRDLQTKSSFLFSPQIGMAALGIRNNINEVKIIPKLIIGININFRSIDKNIKVKYIEKKSVFHYLSLSVALTLGKFDDSEFDNLYTGNSLLVGPTLKLSRSFYLSGGLSIFKQQNKNPLINTKEFAFGGYFSTLLDLDITQAISSFRTLLFK